MPPVTHPPAVGGTSGLGAQHREPTIRVRIFPLTQPQPPVQITGEGAADVGKAVLRLHAGEPDWRNDLYRRHQPAHRARVGTPGRRGARFHEPLPRPPAGVVRGAWDRRERDPTREADEGMAAGVEDQADSRVQPELGRSVSGVGDPSWRFPATAVSEAAGYPVTACRYPHPSPPQPSPTHPNHRPSSRRRPGPSTRRGWFKVRCLHFVETSMEMDSRVGPSVRRAVRRLLGPGLRRDDVREWGWGGDPSHPTPSRRSRGSRRTGGSRGWRRCRRGPAVRRGCRFRRCGPGPAPRCDPCGRWWRAGARWR